MKTAWRRALRAVVRAPGPGYHRTMTGSDQQPEDPPGGAAPALPDVESPPPEDVLEGVPSTEEIIEHAQSAAEIVDQQPTVDDILRRRG